MQRGGARLVDVEHALEAGQLEDAADVSLRRDDGEPLAEGRGSREERVDRPRLEKLETGAIDDDRGHTRPQGVLQLPPEAIAREVGLACELEDKNTLGDLLD
jgi:hypothetical protein